MSPPAWPSALSHSPTIAALEAALSGGRLGHALLLVAPDAEVADAAAVALAGHLLGGAIPHADYTYVQSANKQRQIGVEPMRAMREFLQKSSLTGTKVAHISQADRLSGASANLFLKILEEPPTGSYIIMTTAQPYAVLPTIVSRAMRWRLGGATTPRTDAIEAWCTGLHSYLSAQPLATAGTAFFARYQLLHSAFTLLSIDTEAPAGRRAAPKDDATETLSKEEKEAMEVAQQKAYRREFLAAVERTIVEAYKANPTRSDLLASNLRSVERAYRLMELNLNIGAALELAIP